MRDSTVGSCPAHSRWGSCGYLGNAGSVKDRWHCKNVAPRSDRMTRACRQCAHTPASCRGSLVVIVTNPAMGQGASVSVVSAFMIVGAVFSVAFCFDFSLVFGTAAGFALAAAFSAGTAENA